MDDHLERFIKENRNSFDDSYPSKDSWEKLEYKLNSKRSFQGLIWKVAAILFMISTLYLIIDRNINLQNDGPVFSEEFNQAEDYYIQLIDQRKQIIQHQLSSKEQKDFLDEIDHLDALYSELKKTYQTNASNDRILDAMINNLQLRLEILDKQLDILSKIKNQNSQNDTFLEI